MSAASPQQNSRRNHRQRKAPSTAAAQQQQTNHNEGVDMNHEAQPSTTPSKPRKNKSHQRSQQPQSHSDNGMPNHNPVSPLTPPRPSNQTNVPGADLSVSPIANGNHTNGKSKKKNHGNNQRETQSATPKPRKGRSPQPEHQPSTTPAKATQIYAGPTFHASPAASSLPIPKFFSKSMPQVDNKEASLTAMMQDDVSEESTSQGDVSPTMRSSVKVQEQLEQQKSPLDIFFKADRAQKALRDSGSETSRLSTPNDKFRAASASPARIHSSHHSRQPTDSSIFPLEMDGEPWKSAQYLPKSTPPPSVLSDNEINHKSSVKTDVAKTQALKQVLFSMTQENTKSGLPSPSPSPTPSRNGEYFSPSPNARSRSSSPYSSIYGGGLSDSKPMPVRTYSSQLRQEISMEAVSELPTTPTPSRSQDFFKDSPYMKAGFPQPRHASPRPPVKFEARDALKVSLGKSAGTHTSHEDMELKLREILKLESLSSTGVR